MKGLYIHIPFCSTKCDYCDFYSIKYSQSVVEQYVNSLIKRLKNIDEFFDSVYFGGGTPSIIGGENIAMILKYVNFPENCEITVECNPNSATYDFFKSVAPGGVNRVSIGLQSANEQELRFLTRRHSSEDVKKAVNNAKLAGINNISLDVIIGIKNQTKTSLKNTLNFCIALDVNHISAYMLQIEPNTPMFNIDKSTLPDDDYTALLYQFLSEYLNEKGIIKYEISNFAKKGFESRHNLKYWNCQQYLGLGPSAHSFINGKRFYYPKDINYFINDGEPIFDCYGGDFKEYVMLKLRLVEGVNFEILKSKGFTISNAFLNKCKTLERQGLCYLDNKGVRLTEEGFLVQNSVILYLFE